VARLMRLSRTGLGILFPGRSLGYTMAGGWKPLEKLSIQERRAAVAEMRRIAGREGGAAPEKRWASSQQLPSASSINLAGQISQALCRPGGSACLSLPRLHSVLLPSRMLVSKHLRQRTCQWPLRAEARSVWWAMRPSRQPTKCFIKQTIECDRD